MNIKLLYCFFYLLTIFPVWSSHTYAYLHQLFTKYVVHIKNKTMGYYYMTTLGVHHLHLHK